MLWQCGLFSRTVWKNDCEDRERIGEEDDK